MHASSHKPFRLGADWRHSQDGDAVITSINPADGSIAGRVTCALPRDVDTAVTIAWDAFQRQPWRKLRPDQRAATLYEISRRLAAERERWRGCR